MKVLLRKMHRWLGLLMAVQIMAWMASGLWFSMFPIETFRGEHLTRPAEDLQSGSAPESLNLYLDPWTGEILARRTTRWRIFDFLWMLHIMDFETRDSFNHPLLQVAAALGLIIALSGVVLWAFTTRVFRRRQSPP